MVRAETPYPTRRNRLPEESLESPGDRVLELNLRGWGENIPDTVVLEVSVCKNT